MFVGLLYVWYKLVEQRGLLEMSTCPSFRLSVFTQTSISVVKLSETFRTQHYTISKMFAFFSIETLGIEEDTTFFE